jgi:predicted transcriptional regulator
MDTPTERTDWRATLKEQGRTMAWLADNTGKSRRTVYAYSRGQLIPPAQWIADVSRLLGREVA